MVEQHENTDHRKTGVVVTKGDINMWDLGGQVR